MRATASASGDLERLRRDRGRAIEHEHPAVGLLALEQLEHGDAAPLRDGPHRRLPLERHEHGARVEVRQVEVELRVGIGRIQRRAGGRACDTQECDGHARAVRQHDCHAVGPAHARAAQPRREALHLPVQLAVGERRAAREHQRGRVGMPRGLEGKQAVDRGRRRRPCSSLLKPGDPFVAGADQEILTGP